MIIWDPEKCGINDEINIADYADRKRCDYLGLTILNHRRSFAIYQAKAKKQETGYLKWMKLPKHN